MAQSKQSETEESPPFVLKHRIAGAACLIFFGVLVLPWLLGPPSDASGVDAKSAAQGAIASVSSADIEDELLAGVDEDAAEVADEVYISKITPLDSQNKSLATQASETLSLLEKNTSDKNSTNSQSSIAKVGKQDSSEKSKQEALTLLALEADNAKIERERLEEIAQDQKKKQAEQSAKRKTNVEADLAKALAAEAASIKAAGQKVAKPSSAKPEDKPKVEIGWAVQVGLFENKTGAQKVVQDLKSKGFSPSVTVVDTNRGKNTGTRVWLGPFAQRVDAAKVMSRLAERTGQAGFIRAYP